MTSIGEAFITSFGSSLAGLHDRRSGGAMSNSRGIAMAAMGPVGALLGAIGRTGSNYEVADAAQLNVFTKSGTVTAVQGRTVQSTTTQYSSGSVNTNFGGRVTSVTPATAHVQTSSTHLQRFFVREDDGSEFDVELPDVSFGVREGQRLTLVCAGRIGETGAPVALINHDTGRHEIFPRRVDWLYRRPSGFLRFAMLLSLPVALWVIAAFGFNVLSWRPIIYGFVIGGGVLAWRYWAASRLRAAILEKLNAAVATAIRSTKEASRAA
ncbi:hypothetical protein [Brevundimonas sp. GCM10030266]|uniref:hypothetical protein n=1 Tax=Brevundimonas sp. GCM10030266 TaxID=3273386 RepID=UPI00360643B3